MSIIMKTHNRNEIEKFKKDGFKNVIYEVTGGEFAKQIQNISDDRVSLRP